MPGLDSCQFQQRTMRLKVVYTIVTTTNSSNGQQQQKTSSSSSSEPATTARSTHVARSNGDDTTASMLSSAQSGYGWTSLKACMTLICYSRPDLIPNQRTDHAVSVLDVIESESLGNKVFEGKGMMGWLLAETDYGSTRALGRIINDPAAENNGKTLEVVLEIMPRAPILQQNLLSNIGQQQQPASNPSAPDTRPSFPSSMEHTAPHYQQQHPHTTQAPAAQGKVPLPGGGEIDASQVMFMLQTLGQWANLGQSTNGDSSVNAFQSLLPGINLPSPAFSAQSFQQIQQHATQSDSQYSPATASLLERFAKATKGETSAPKEPPQPEKPARRPPQPRKPMPEPTKRARDAPSKPASKNGEKTLKYWAAGCLKCGRTESVMWRVRRKRKAPLDGGQGPPQDMDKDDDDEVKKLCEECAQVLPTVQRKRHEAEANAAAAAAARGPASDAPAPAPSNRHAQARTIHSVVTSPIRRSPRRHASSRVMGPAGVSQTSPVQPNKRRKFQTALSRAAVFEEAKNSPVPTDDDAGMVTDQGDSKQKAKRIFSRGQSSPPRLAPSAEGSTTFAGIDFNLDPASELPDSQGGQVPDLDFLMNASPNSAIRSILGGGGSGTPKMQDSPGKMLSRFLASISATPKAASATALDDLQSGLGANNDTKMQDASALFSPNALSTPFRNAIFGRAVSEGPATSHQKLHEQLYPGQQHTSSEIGAPVVQINLQPPTADRRLAQQHPSALDPPSDSQALLDDFSSFLLNTSSGLVSSPVMMTGVKHVASPTRPPKHTSSLAPLQFPVKRNAWLHQNYLEPSSEFDGPMDMKDLPPSSPPPLPAYQFKGLAGFMSQVDDGQSPISIGTSVTGAGTPQEAFPPQPEQQQKDSHAAAQSKTDQVTSWLDGDLRNGDANTSGSISLVDEDDPLLAFMTDKSSGNTSRPQSRLSGSSVGLTWSESNASSSSLASLGKHTRTSSGVAHTLHKRNWSDTASDLLSGFDTSTPLVSGQ